MSLQNWSDAGWISSHSPKSKEISQAFAGADRALSDAQAVGLSPDGRFIFYYQSILLVASAALTASGFRASRDQHHHRVLKSLLYTLELDSNQVTQLDKFRKKRNLGLYEVAGAISEKEVSEIGAIAQRLRVDVEAWINKHHPHLVEGVSR